MEGEGSSFQEIDRGFLDRSLCSRLRYAIHALSHASLCSLALTTCFVTDVSALVLAALACVKPLLLNNCERDCK